jgi:hypothetical protein
MLLSPVLLGLKRGLPLLNQLLHSFRGTSFCRDHPACPRRATFGNRQVRKDAMALDLHGCQADRCHLQELPVVLPRPARFAVSRHCLIERFYLIGDRGFRRQTRA